MQLSLDEIYMKCGLKHPDVYLKDLHNSVLFSGDPNLHRDVIEHNRRTGKTTLIVVKMIKNTFEGKSSTIYTGTMYAAGLFNRYIHRFKTETEEDPRFVNCRIESIEITSNDTHIINNKVRINFRPGVMYHYLASAEHFIFPSGTDFDYFDI
jgi:hypothetical protein